MTDKKLFTIFLIITVAGGVLNAVNSAAYSGWVMPQWAWWVVYITNFTDAALMLHLGTRVLGLSTPFKTNVGISLFSGIVSLLIMFMGIGAAIMPFGLIIIGALVILFMRVYDIGLGRALGLMVIQALGVLAINLAVSLLAYLIYRVLALVNTI